MTNQLVSNAIEMQRNTLETSQKAIEEAVELPMRQTVEFQRNAAQLFLDGLEMNNWARNQGMELTRDALSTYIDAVENAAENTVGMTEQGIEEAGEAGQQALASTQQFADATAGDGARPPAQQEAHPAQQGTWQYTGQPPRSPPQPTQQAPQTAGTPPRSPEGGQGTQAPPQQSMAPPQQSVTPPQQSVTPQQSRAPPQRAPAPARPGPTAGPQPTPNRAQQAPQGPARAQSPPLWGGQPQAPTTPQQAPQGSQSRPEPQPPAEGVPRTDGTAANGSETESEMAETPAENT